MKRVCSGLILLICFLALLTPAAQAAESPLVIDQADLLTQQEETALAEQAAALGETYGMDVVILLNESLDGKTPEVYADDYYDQHGYGEDGILFLLSMEFRDWYISTCGAGIYAFTDYGIEQLGGQILPELGQGRYYEAFALYLDALIPYLDAYAQGTPIDGMADTSGDFYTGTQEDIVHYEKAPSFSRLLLTSIPVGLIGAAVVVVLMRTSMNTKRKQAAASVYLQDRSFHVHRCQDLFLYSNIRKTQRQESNGSSRSGGSSVHVSSGGRSHGGGGGKF